MTKPAIVQFWDREPPGEVLALMETWRTGPCVATFRYERFNDATALDFIRQHFDRRTVNAFRQCGIPAMKADFFRYCFLYQEGGIYIDADTCCLQSLDGLYDGLDLGLLFKRKKRVANDFLIAKQKQTELFAYTIEKAITNIEARTSDRVWHVTGPSIMTFLYNSGSAEAERLFRGFQVVKSRVIRPFVGFRRNLEYKSSDTHWTIAQQKTSIFDDG
jgi:mannosyltransferase OCH1-like enzyme